MILSQKYKHETSPPLHKMNNNNKKKEKPLVVDFKHFIFLPGNLYRVVKKTISLKTISTPYLKLNQISETIKFPHQIHVKELPGSICILHSTI